MDKWWLKEIRKYWQLVLLRCPPFELQHSVVLLVAFVFILILLQWISQQIALPEQHIGFALIAVLVAITIRCLPLFIMNRSDRLVRTLLALLGADLIVQTPRFIGVFLTVYFNHTGLISVLVYVSLVWRLMVSAYIYQYALGLSLGKSYILVTVILICEVLLINQVLSYLS